VVGAYWERAEICWPLVRRLPELGIVGEDIKGYGCAGMSPMACGLVTMELHRGDGSLGVFLGVHAGLAMLSIAMCGSEEQKARWLPDMARLDKLGAFALTEPQHGSDSVALETSARRGGDGWVLNGRKRWIGLGTVADLIVVWAQRRRRAGQRLRRGAGVAGLPGEGHRGEGVAALGVAGRHHPGRRAGAGREPAARGALV
ncbi:MAG TPA: acyl-CoA dehydrogenase family protein, partial [Streptosporangiaceae bacterium]|nr:acyl-CoA dehydrogenase family protein [Streptosporangiaceae bacterium]